MKSIFLVAIIATIVPLYLTGAEPSAFGAGNLNNDKPYGLTSSEKVLLQNKKSLKKVVVKSNNQANEVDSLRERLDGLQSIIESLSRKSQTNKVDIKNLTKKNEDELSSSDEYEKRLSSISQINSQRIRDLNQTIGEMKALHSELSIIVDDMNSSFVSKDDFNSLVNDFNTFKQLVVKEFKSSATPKSSKLSSMSNAQVAKLARKNYGKKLYTKSIEQYSYLIDKSYKPAHSHYMIGEMNYYRKKYSDAIAYFKKSASLYSKASYMPILMLHTAVAMEKTGDKRNAKSFYNAIISKYPKSKQVKTAKSRLKKLN